MAPKKNKDIKDYELFIFDWDGTLNSMRLTLRVNEAVKRSLHIWNRDSSIKDFKKMDPDLKKQLKNEARKNNVETFLFDVFLNFSRPRLHNDTIALLKTLKRKGKKIAVFSNGRSSRISKEMKYLGVLRYFDYVISGRDLNALKPNPTGLKLILKSLNVKSENAVYIGDMCDDVITAKLASVHSCAISTGFDSYHALRSIHPDYLFKSIAELKNAVQR